LTPEEMARASEAHTAYTEDRQKRLDTNQADLIDRRTRMQQASTGLRQLQTIKVSTDTIEKILPGILESGVAGRIKGGLRATVNDWIQNDDRLKALTTLSAATLGPIVRQISMDTGAMSVSDVDRAADAFAIKASDNMEFAIVKLRALQRFMAAATSGWNVYASTSMFTPIAEMTRQYDAISKELAAAVAQAENAKSLTGYRVGETATIEGKTITIDRVNPDGSIHGVDMYGKGYTWRP
jgi:hypothetical protein